MFNSKTLTNNIGCCLSTLRHERYLVTTLSSLPRHLSGFFIIWIFVSRYIPHPPILRITRARNRHSNNSASNSNWITNPSIISVFANQIF